MTRTPSIVFTFLSAAAVVATTALAAADDQFDLAVAKDEVTVVTKGHWHVNQDYPWKVVIGDATFDKSKFVFTERSAKLSGVPHGTGKLKGAVCDGPQCMPFVKEITIR
jgi:hypothetical protein